MKTEKKRSWLTGAQFKWIAIIIMAIDHGAAVFLEPTLTNATVNTANYELLQNVYRIYMILRYIGRFAFPGFCFLLVEGFFHTRSKAKYFQNLVIFSLISEIPFDLALHDRVCYWGYQNVFFTLAAGFGAIWISEYFLTKSIKEFSNAVLYRSLSIASVFAIAFVAEILHTDYGAVGVATIYVLYALRNKPVIGSLVAWGILSLHNVVEIYCLPFVGAVYLYNGERGKQNKYFFYAFYPLHLLIFYLLKVIIF